MPNSMPPTASHSSRLASSRPLSGGSWLLRSAAVQYLVAWKKADRPNGSDKAATVSSAGSRNITRVMA